MKYGGWRRGLVAEGRNSSRYYYYPFCLHTTHDSSSGFAVCLEMVRPQFCGCIGHILPKHHNHQQRQQASHEENECTAVSQSLFTFRVLVSRNDQDDPMCAVMDDINGDVASAFEHKGGLSRVLRELKRFESFVG